MSPSSHRQTYQHAPQYASVPSQSPPRKSPYNSSYTSYQYQQPYSSQNGSYARSLSRHDASPENRQHMERHGVVMGVATGNIGAGYGPYSYHPEQIRDTGVYNNYRFENNPSEASFGTISREYDYEGQPPKMPEPTPVPPSQSESKPRTTTTVPQYLWDKEDLDDPLHDPNPRGESEFTCLSFRGWTNASAIIIIVIGLFMLFAGYPAIYHFSHLPHPFIGFNAGGINASGQIPLLPNLPRMIDPDTPESAKTRVGDDGLVYELTFSDEFNVDGRTFYPGDDPFWEAENLWYWPTNDVEWYDPSAVTTENGKMVITMTEESINGLNFKSGMVTSWNKICFNTGYVEVSISMPGEPGNPVPGLWPGAWTLGNLGRAGYGATNQGMWPYSYDTCDVGTFPGQIGKDGQPAAAATGGKGGVPLSSQPGQKLSACTCPGNEHPGPSVNVGRGVPEIDIIEAQIDVSRRQGEVSQSFQCAPYDMGLNFNIDGMTIYNTTRTFPNSYTGGPFQQAMSAVSYVDNAFFGGGEGAFAPYGFEYWSDPNHREDGYITWYYNGERTWKADASMVGINTESKVQQRLISEEPMYLILNLGMAPDFQKPDFKNLKFPAKMYIDYVRIYQRRGIQNGMTCNPPNRPTTDYINKHLVAYTNPQLTVWSDANYTFPRNSLYDGC